jgi:hypothetical protein
MTADRWSHLDLTPEQVAAINTAFPAASRKQGKAAKPELPQLSRADVVRMSKEDPGSVEKARRNGQLDELLAGRDPSPAVAPPLEEGQLTREQVTELAKTPGELVKAHKEGRLRHLGVGQPNP